MTRRHRLLAAAAAIGALMAGVALAPPVHAAATAPQFQGGIGACAGASGAVVAVDFRGATPGSVVRGCDPTPTTGLDLLTTAGFTTTGTVHDGPSFICRIGSAQYTGVQYPTPAQEACAVTPPASRYWSYWVADPGATTWRYSSLGAYANPTSQGTAEAWVYGSTALDGSTGQPSFTPADVRGGTGAVSVLTAPGTLQSGQLIASPSGGFVFTMQTDGNAVLYGPGNTVLYSVITGSPGASLAAQSDGNLVIYSAAHTPLWSSGRFPGRGSTLVLQADGNLVQYSAGGAAVWFSGTTQPAASSDRLRPGYYLSAGQSLPSSDGAYSAVMQADGNFVVYGPAGPIWSSVTRGASAFVTLQGDGNVVVYRGAGAVWNTATYGHPGAYLVMQSDGNLVVYAGTAPLWNSRGYPV